MPFEFVQHRPANIAVIGAGISGMGAAHLLAKHNRVTLIESENRLGGHARTVMAGKNGTMPVDSGFIVFNYANYPRMTKLFEALNVPVKKSNMSFAVSANSGRIEYALNSLNSLFGSRRLMMNPRFLGMLNDIRTFNRDAERVAASDPSLTVGGLMDRLKLGRWFREYYLLPFSGAIWSVPLAQMLSFPADALLRFFRNHNLLAYTGQHQWYTVDGGSVEYVSRLGRDMIDRGVNIRLAAPVKSVKRGPDQVKIRCEGGDWEAYDRVVFACHSDQALSMLDAPTEAERTQLGAIKYQPNKAVMHRDPVVMPQRKRCWASWVHASDTETSDRPVGVSYWMNLLQSLPDEDPVFQSLNPTRDIRDELIYDETTFAHPVFDHAAIDAQKEIRTLQGQNNTWYCGAYMKNGFHEDGYSSGVDVVEHMSRVMA